MISLSERVDLSVREMRALGTYFDAVDRIGEARAIHRAAALLEEQQAVIALAEESCEEVKQRRDAHYLAEKRAAAAEAKLAVVQSKYDVVSEQNLAIEQDRASLQAMLANMRQSLAYLCEINSVTDSRFIEATFKLHEFDAKAADELFSAHRRYLKKRGEEQG